MSMDDALNTFIIESRELLQQMEEALLHLEQSGDDPETINAIFRAAHTIKGSAGLFGLDHVVSFTHVAESVLDRVRDGELSIMGDLAALLLEVCDYLGVLVNLIADDGELDEATRQVGGVLVGRLTHYLNTSTDADAANGGEADAPRSVPSVTGQGNGPDAFTRHSDDAAETDNWHISLRFGPDVLRDGMDPASFIRYLGTLGRIVRIVTLLDGMPSVEEMDPESNYLGFEIGFRSSADKATIEGVFEFVRDDCQIRILPPHSKVAEYQALIQDLPEEEMRLGEILIRCGTLTQPELERVLALQAEKPSPIGEVLVAEKMVRPAVVEAALEKQKQVKEQRGGEASLIRVDAAKLDHLINLIGELIIAGAGADLIAQQAGIPELAEATATMSRLVEEVRDSALTLRMVQIGGTFNRFQRVVRDVSKELGKDIRLEISGGETELDKTVVERIGDPLTHLVRNSMDHGIESAELRLANGKPAHGTVRLNADHDAGSIVIEVVDDGGGLDRERIFAKAVEKDLIAPDAVLTDREVYNLIFEPGFSTASQVSNLSGRGVGMDVVRRNIQALRGTVDLDSEPGKGSTVRIRLPLTLAIIDGFLIGVAESAFVVPLDMVVECMELDRTTQASASGNYINLRGEVLPFIRLREHFEVEGLPARRENIVVVNHAGRKAGLVVDRLMGEFQTVIKPLGKVFANVRGIGGFTILGSGEVAVILDVAGLVRQANSGEPHASGQMAMMD